MLAPLRTSVDTIATQASTASNVNQHLVCSRVGRGRKRFAFTASEAIRSLQNSRISVKKSAFGKASAAA